MMLWEFKEKNFTKRIFNDDNWTSAECFFPKERDNFKRVNSFFILTILQNR